MGIGVLDLVIVDRETVQFAAQLASLCGEIQAHQGLFV